MNDARLAKEFVLDSQKTMKRYLPRILSCLKQLSDEDIWWRPNQVSNSAGNLVLHLCGNIRQWIIAGLGGESDIRERDKEFSEHGPIRRRVLIERLSNTVNQACRIMDGLDAEELLRRYTIQGYRTTGLRAVAHVCEHFSHHAGQIIYITKTKGSKNLGFTHLPPSRVMKQPRIKRAG